MNEVENKTTYKMTGFPIIELEPVKSDEQAKLDLTEEKETKWLE